jgi:hypothetical protein
MLVPMDTNMGQGKYPGPSVLRAEFNICAAGRGQPGSAVAIFMWEGIRTIGTRNAQELEKEDQQLFTKRVRRRTRAGVLTTHKLTSSNNFSSNLN